jgi:hypothetical protein
MSDFDRLLERTLKQMLDPVVVGPVPVRRGQAQAWPPFGSPAIMFGHPRPLLARLHARAMQSPRRTAESGEPVEPGELTRFHLIDLYP